jgi:polyisoprenoid-binding protein YceI
MKSSFVLPVLVIVSLTALSRTSTAQSVHPLSNAFSAAAGVGEPSPDSRTARRSWEVDSSRSAARLFLGTGNDPLAYNAAVARVTGEVAVDAGDPAKSKFELTIYPADQQGPANVDGRLVGGIFPSSADFVQMNFRSNQAERQDDGKWRVTGELTILRVERPATVDPNEGYAGPVYGEPVAHAVTHNATFVFSIPSSASDVSAKVSATAHIQHRNFPEVLPAVRDAEWPMIVQNETCENPSPAEDYFGPQCTAQVVDVLPPNVAEVTTGEDYHGPQPTAPSGDQVTIVLNLQTKTYMSQAR